MLGIHVMVKIMFPLYLTKYHAIKPYSSLN